MRFVTCLTVFKIRGGVHINFRRSGLPGFLTGALPVISLSAAVGLRGHPVSEVRVAGQAQVRIIRQEQIPQIGFMGTMAPRALAGHNRIVLAFFVLDFPFGIGAVAGVT